MSGIEDLVKIAKKVAAEERKENPSCPAAVTMDVLRERVEKNDGAAANVLLALLAERSTALQVSGAIKRNKR